MWTFKFQSIPLFFWICRVQTRHLTPLLKNAPPFCPEGRTRYKGMARHEAWWTQPVVYPLWKGIFRFWQMLQYSQSKFKIFKIKNTLCTANPPQMGKAVEVMLDLKSAWNPVARVQAKAFFVPHLWSSLAWVVYPAECASCWITEEQEERPWTSCGTRLPLLFLSGDKKWSFFSLQCRRCFNYSSGAAVQWLFLIPAASRVVSRAAAALGSENRDFLTSGSSQNPRLGRVRSQDI